MKPFFSIIIFLMCAANCGAAASLSEKEQVRQIVRRVEALSRCTRTLDELGRGTLAQSKEVLDIGPAAVYALSVCLDCDDWKVRFWIADIMGYLDNPDAQRPLLRLLNSPGENKKVRRQAYKSLKRLNIMVPVDVREGL